MTDPFNPCIFKEADDLLINLAATCASVDQSNRKMTAKLLKLIRIYLMATTIYDDAVRSAIAEIELQEESALAEELIPILMDAQGAVSKLLKEANP